MTLSQTPSVLHSKKILLVDSKPDNAYLAQRYLRTLWVDQENIAIAKDWFAAIELAKKELFDVIVTEMSLPWMDGTEISQKIRAMYPENSPKMVVYTANQFIKKIPQIEESFDNIIIKPASRETFEEKLLEVFAMENDKN